MTLLHTEVPCYFLATFLNIYLKYQATFIYETRWSLLWIFRESIFVSLLGEHLISCPSVRTLFTSLLFMVIFFCMCFITCSYRRYVSVRFISVWYLHFMQMSSIDFLRIHGTFMFNSSMTGVIISTGTSNTSIFSLLSSVL